MSDKPDSPNRDESERFRRFNIMVDIAVEAGCVALAASEDPKQGVRAALWIMLQALHSENYLLLLPDTLNALERARADATQRAAVRATSPRGKASRQRNLGIAEGLAEAIRIIKESQNS